MQREAHSFISFQMRGCIQECENCHDICVEMITHCIEMGGLHARSEHIRLLMDCAEICQTNAGFMLRGSDLHPHTCRVCAEVCDRCAESCENFRDDELMEQCANLCRDCAQSCREMAQVF